MIDGAQRDVKAASHILRIALNLDQSSEIFDLLMISAKRVDSAWMV